MRTPMIWYRRRYQTWRCSQIDSRTTSPPQIVLLPRFSKALPLIMSLFYLFFSYTYLDTSLIAPFNIVQILSKAPLQMVRVAGTWRQPSQDSSTSPSSLESSQVTVDNTYPQEVIRDRHYRSISITSIDWEFTYVYHLLLKTAQNH